MLRKELLEKAISLTCGDRDIEYGSPVDNLSNCADLWSAYFRGRCRNKLPGTQETETTFVISAEDVAWLNVLQKIARTFSGNARSDTYEDAAAYAAIAGECHFEEDDE